MQQRLEEANTAGWTGEKRHVYVTTGKVLGEDGDPRLALDREKFEWDKSKAGGGAATEYTKVYDRESAKDWQDRQKKIAAAGLAAEEAASQMDRFDALNKSAAPYQGPTGSWNRTIDMWTPGSDNFYGTDQQLDDAQVFEAMGNQFALDLKNPDTGTPMPGAMSDADRAFLTSMAPGLEAKRTPDGNAKLIDAKRRMARRQAEIAELADMYAEKNGGRLDQGFDRVVRQFAKENPLFPEAGKQTTSLPPRDQLVPGQVYQTSKGALVWDGNSFTDEVR
jgi:hypothetical protein